MPGGVAKVPINCYVNNMGGYSYNGTNCTQYNVQIQSSDGASHSISVAVPSGIYVNPTSATVPATGYVYVYVYVPVGNSGSVSMTASSSGYTDHEVPIKS